MSISSILATCIFIMVGLRLPVAATTTTPSVNDYVPPRCTKEILKDINGFMFALDGTIYGDLRIHNSTWGGFIEGARDLHDFLVKQKTPFAYLSNSGSKGAPGVDAKFRALGMANGIGENRAWTAGSAIAAFLKKNAGNRSRIFVLDSTSTFNGETDSCLRQIQSVQGATDWILKVNLTDADAKAWAQDAKHETANVFVASCVDNNLDAAADGAHRVGIGTCSNMRHGCWPTGQHLLATLLMISVAQIWIPNIPTSTFNLPNPGPGSFLSLLRQASFLRNSSKDFVVGKGGNAGNEFMFNVAYGLLQKQAPEQILKVDGLAMVGDTLSSDILGGSNYGAKTIWLTKTGVDDLQALKYYPRLRPTCFATEIKEVLSLLQQNLEFSSTRDAPQLVMV